MFKKIFLFVLILAIAAAGAIFFYRYNILRYSAETVIRRLLPGYASVDKINFDFQKGEVSLGGFRILNPRGFSDKYLIEIEEVVCQYSMKGKNILEGIDLQAPVLKKAVLRIERLRDGGVNLMEMQKVIEPASPRPKAGASGMAANASSGLMSNIKFSDVVKLPEEFLLEDSKIVFVDRLGLPRPHMITFEGIEGRISIKLDENYTKVLRLSSDGKGNLNGNRGEVIKWNIALDPATPKLTMSNRFEVYSVDMLPFEPYYDRYSPFIFEKGTISGLLIFDFDNGNIGSTNELHLSNLRFSVKRGYENARFWETTVPDLVKYFTSPFGDIVFDFKIKGDMADPKFYLGPISKQAIASMAIDKISAAIQKASEPQAEGAPKGKEEEIKEYIDLFKGLINKK